MSRFSVKFVTRDQCPLCDEARPLVEKAVGRSGGWLEEVDVDSTAELAGLYGERVPVVVADDGTLLAEGRIDARVLKRSLNAWRRGRL